ncbi:MAG: gliding motility-associated C-terminal domain-containing protein, partial [Saprospiraceae bacterium]|nr:gliding motility-associated C-terminal domain-containing protein [Saprospiraceae bacterium]
LDHQQYSVSAVSQQGCTATTAFSIRVDPRLRMFAPNVFSPNGDGVNDVWYPTVDEPGIQELLEFMIVDRWGSAILHRRGPGLGISAMSWDGTAGGEGVAPGVYTYSLQLLLPDDRIIIHSGTITVIR